MEHSEVTKRSTTTKLSAPSAQARRSGQRICLLADARAEICLLRPPLGMPA